MEKSKHHIKVHQNGPQNIEEKAEPNKYQETVCGISILIGAPGCGRNVLLIEEGCLP
jgi:hypothetical protein